MDEICDDAAFDKLVGGGLSNLRKRRRRARVCSPPTPTTRLWHRAHNILLAPFSLQSMQDYMPMMLDLAEQLCDKWERLNPDEEVDVPADMTRLTLDTIALCGFGYRFNSFYRDDPAPVRRRDGAHARGVPAARPVDCRSSPGFGCGRPVSWKRTRRS